MSSASRGLMPVSIAVGNAADLEGVMEVMGAAFDSEFGEGWSRSQCAGILPLTGVTLAIARDGHDRIRGFALQRTVAGESELLLLAVHPAAQGAGVGGQLLDYFARSSRALGATRLHLEVRDGNPAIAMYRAFGFRPEGRRANYYKGTDGGLFDAITMGLDVD